MGIEEIKEMNQMRKDIDALMLTIKKMDAIQSQHIYEYHQTRLDLLNHINKDFSQLKTHIKQIYEDMLEVRQEFEVLNAAIVELMVDRK